MKPNSYKIALFSIALFLFANLVVHGQAQLTWSARDVINDYAFIDAVSENERSPKIATDGTGTWLSLWLSQHAENEVSFAASQDNGASWSAPSKIVLPLADRELVLEADLTYAGNNTWVAVWALHTNNSNGSELFSAYSTNDGQSWSTASPLDDGGVNTDNSQFPHNLEICSDGLGNVLVSWSDTVNGTGKAMLVRSSDSGESWSDPVFMPLPQGQNFAAAATELAYAGNGKWMAAIPVSLPGEMPSPFIDVTQYSAAASTDNGVTWSFSGPLLKVRSYSAYEPQADLQIRNNTGVFAAWNFLSLDDTNVNSNSELLVCSSTDGGTTFTSPAQIDSSFDYLPFSSIQGISIDADASDNWVMATHGGDYSPVKLWKGSDAASTWTLVKTLPVQYEENWVPDLAASPDGNFLAVLQHNNDLAPPETGDSDILTVGSSNNGIDWSSGTYVNTTAETDSIYSGDNQVQIATSGSSMVACWLASTFTPFNNKHAIIMSRSVDGGLSWAPGQVIHSFDQPRGGSTNGNPLPVYIGSGKWLIHWTSPDNGQLVSYSSDDGESWSSPAQTISDLIESNGSGTLIAAEKGNAGTGQTSLTMSTDAGLTWQGLATVPVPDVRFIKHTGGSHWIIVGSDNQLLTSPDDGATWNSISNVPLMIHSIDADGSGKVVVAESTLTNSKLVLTYASVSTDYGATWAAKSLVHSHERDFDRYESTAKGYPHILHIGEQRWGLFVLSEMITRTAFNAPPIREFVDLLFLSSDDGAVNWNAPTQLLYSTDFALGTAVNPLEVGYGVSQYSLIAAWVSSRPLDIDAQDPGFDQDIFYRRGAYPQTSVRHWSLY